MPRIRSIKPEACTSETLSELPREVCWSFALLWTHCDDEGRHRADPRIIRAALYPMRDDVTNVSMAGELDLMETAGLICVYTGCDGKTYLHIPSWDDHQHIQRPTPSKLPPCRAHEPESECRKHGLVCGSEPSTTAAAEPVTSDDDLSGMDFTEDSVSVPVNGKSLPASLGVGSGSGSGSRKEERPAGEPRDDVDQLCQRLVERLVANGCKPPTVTKVWRDEARLLLDRDNRDLAEALGLIDWCTKHTFWHRNILSMPKFRHQYERLRLEQRAEGKPRGPTAMRGGHLSLDPNRDYSHINV